MHHWRTQWVPQEREANYPDCSGSGEGGEPLPCDIDIGRGLSPTEAITTQNKSDLLLMTTRSYYNNCIFKDPWHQAEVGGPSADAAAQSW